MSTGQLIVTIAFLGLLGALHLALRAARAPAAGAAAAPPRTTLRRIPLLPILVLAALAALVFAGVAYVVSVLDEEETTTAPTTAATTTTTAAPTTTTTAAPPPPQPPPPPPPPLQAPEGTALVARVVTEPDGALAAARSRVGARPKVTERETGVYYVDVPGLSPALRQRAAIRARPADGGIKASTRKLASGAGADFAVFTRDAKSGDFAESGFELAVYLPKQALEGAGGEEGRNQLPPTR